MSELNFNPDGVGIDTGTYFGMPYTTESADLVLISAPWDVTVSYGAGTSYAPDALIEASTQLDFYDPAAPNAWKRGIATADIDYSIQELSQRLRHDARRVIEHLEQGGSTADDYVVRKIRRVNEGSAELNLNIRKQAAQWLEQGKLVGLVGGDHSTPYGLVQALAEQHHAFGILHIDAHCDLREAYEGFPNSHASIMYNIMESLPTVSHLVQVGIRDYCEDEIAYAERSGRITQFADHTLAERKMEGEKWSEICDSIIEALPEKVYISFDIDGLSPDNCPHTGTPVAGGLSYNEAAYLLKRLGDSGRTIIGFDLTEVVPSGENSIDAGVGARILFKLCGQTLRTNR
jgi:agmatinase